MDFFEPLDEMYGEMFDYDRDGSLNDTEHFMEMCYWQNELEQMERSDLGESVDGGYDAFADDEEDDAELARDRFFDELDADGESDDLDGLDDFGEDTDSYW